MGSLPLLCRFADWPPDSSRMAMRCSSIDFPHQHPKPGASWRAVSSTRPMLNQPARSTASTSPTPDLHYAYRRRARRSAHGLAAADHHPLRDDLFLWPDRRRYRPPKAVPVETNGQNPLPLFIPAIASSGPAVIRIGFCWRSAAQALAAAHEEGFVRGSLSCGLL